MTDGTRAKLLYTKSLATFCLVDEKKSGDGEKNKDTLNQLLTCIDDLEKALRIQEHSSSIKKLLKKVMKYHEKYQTKSSESVNCK
jgi:molecular chaperone GrpE (heat shock protein)